ncbi:c-type heme family protein [Defluviicoccus vanus]|uniref:DUF3365 domain-containing protein n=1 Tax=Defluviicoccus vanus TaxID=111831 RepID=A0A7H1MYA1_9PROT|nr:DUF3365 domain-containing protein [Defluviicoccus vanus]QNT68437.1 DUF3365 domain-containing protein [Defluviicoccus vanus]
MGVRLKFNMVLLSVFCGGLLLSAYVSRAILEHNAREDVIGNARIMLEAARGAANYTVQEIQPLLASQMQQLFLPQSVSFYAATQSTQVIGKNLPEYTYRAVALDPTNPRDRAIDWETEVIREFRSNHKLQELITEHDGPTGRILNLSQPIVITNEKCLLCHSDPKIAPRTMTDIYGTANGFGWTLNEPIGAQIVSVPMAVPLQHAHDAFVAFMALLAGIFVLLFALINLLLHVVVIRPVVQMADVANDISLGKTDVPYYTRSGKDEIASLSASFNRMRRSLETALKMLGETN